MGSWTYLPAIFAISFIASLSPYTSSRHYFRCSFFPPFSSVLILHPASIVDISLVGQRHRHSAAHSAFDDNNIISRVPSTQHYLALVEISLSLIIIIFIERFFCNVDP